MSNSSYLKFNSSDVKNEVFFCNTVKRDELNERITERYFPSSTLQSQMSMRPVSTKYSLMPIMDQRMEPSVPIVVTSSFNVGKTFNPGTRQAPWDGYATNVDVETILRNQTFALQKADNSYYIPSSNSDLYNVTAVGRYEEQTHIGLFEKAELSRFNPNKINIANDMFNNSTRQQTKAINDKFN
jgi:hypothetical protein